MARQRKPIIGIVSCRKRLNGYQIQSVNEFYLNAVKDFGGVAIILPSTNSSEALEHIFSLCNGFLFPGSNSNVAPRRYHAKHQENMLDEARDELAINILQLAVKKDIPCLGICRGCQEMNVALGGSLNPAIHQSGFEGHRENPTTDFYEKYAPSHQIVVQKGGIFEQWLIKHQWEKTTGFSVNSLHNQGVERLAAGLQIEARALDGLIEAFRLPNHKFFVGVQWHPEWHAKTNDFSKILFEEFIKSAWK